MVDLGARRCVQSYMLDSSLGLELAKLADLPEDVFTEAERISNKLADQQALKREANKSTKAELRRKAMLRVSFIPAIP